MNREKTIKIFLSKKGSSSEGGQEKLPGTGDNVTAACPDHLILADLSVGKGIGRPVPAGAALRVKNVGQIVHRKPGQKVHFCVECNFPIAIYGRLSPCDHAFCLDCARANCYCNICKAQVQNIRKIDRVKEGIFICGLRSCLKSFLEESALNSHIVEVHGVASSSSVSNGGDGDLRLQPITGPFPRPTAQPGP